MEDIVEKNVKNVLEHRKKLAKELFARRTYKKDCYYNSIRAIYPLQQVQMDLTIMDKVHKKPGNKNYKYILLMIDVYSRFAWAVPLKHKNASDVLAAFKTCFEKQFPEILVSDNDGAFKSVFREFCNENNIFQHMVEVGEHTTLGIVDRMTRTLREKINEEWTINNNYDWLSPLPRIIEDYNKKIHSTTKNAPLDIYMNYPHVENEQEFTKNCLMKKFKKGDRVRKRLKFSIFEKKTNQKWSKQVFTVESHHGNKVVLNDGTMHSPRDLLHTDLPDWNSDELDINKVLKKVAREKKLDFDLKRNLDFSDEDLQKMKDLIENEMKGDTKNETKGDKMRRVSSRDKKKPDKGFFVTDFEMNSKADTKNADTKTKTDAVDEKLRRSSRNKKQTNKGFFVV